MLETDIRKLDFWGKNTVKTQHVNLDDDLDCVVIISSKDDKLSDLLSHKIIDAVLDKVHPKNVYKDFSNALENINSFISTWGNSQEKIKWLHAIVWIYNKKSFLFSSIWEASCYLYNTNSDIIEVTDKEEKPKNFSFISQGDVADGEYIILSNIRLLEVLAKDDLRDGLSGWNIKRSGENIEQILYHEFEWKNLWLISLHKNIALLWDGNTWWDKFVYSFYKIFDNRYAKEFFGYLLHLRDKLLQKSQKTRQYIIAAGIIVAIFFLYTILSWFFQIASNTQGTEASKQQLVEAQASIVAASENLNNPDMYSLNIENAETIIQKLEEQELFLWDISILKDNLSVLQKQFNGISPFEVTPENTMYSFSSPMDIVKIVSISNKIYVVHPKSITGPIIQGETSDNYVFGELAADDYFIDASVNNTDIVIMTHAGKVVNFAKNNFYTYIDVTNQTTWEMSPIISSYAGNLYMLSDSKSQILRHKKTGASYDAGVSYLTDADANSIWKILSIAIDGGIYILKADGTVVKLFREPEYRLESIVLNSLPKNYEFWDIKAEFAPSVRARADLKYVYMLLKNKILIFKPSSDRYQDVKSLLYLWQVEGKEVVIDDFYVDNDGEIFIAAKNGVFKLEFSVVENKVVLD